MVGGPQFGGEATEVMRFTGVDINGGVSDGNAASARPEEEGFGSSWAWTLHPSGYHIISEGEGFPGRRCQKTTFMYSGEA
jgi:hypothetical protein